MQGLGSMVARGGGFFRIVAVLGGLACAASAVQAQEPTASAVENQVIARVNAERAGAGLTSLRPAAELGSAARAHAADLARTGRLSHTGSDGTGFGQRIGQHGYRACLAAENVARGQSDAAAAVRAWMNSPPHRENILRGGVTQVGAARGPGPVWVLVVARPC